MTYRLRVTARAVADADETHAWIAEHGSADQADRWYQGLFKQMQTLIERPTRCPRLAERQIPEELRQLRYGKGTNKHRIIFALRPCSGRGSPASLAVVVVVLLAFAGPRQDLISVRKLMVLVVVAAVLAWFFSRILSGVLGSQGF